MGHPESHFEAFTIQLSLLTNLRITYLPKKCSTGMRNKKLSRPKRSVTKTKPIDAPAARKLTSAISSKDVTTRVKRSAERES
ncbi:unnamed protein product [Nesidiocoris tenuis]|uniref:Uncharacterized protein n=1 Tax=Nesidiocoris tenuis TaxID=355587 RepID=A0A6H5HBG5_9HEMI|nr:unnamed protein product [Nesidiocoris tenuis]CAB0013447.1 unnamed protein product [Nesidiocoris tenuis]